MTTENENRKLLLLALAGIAVLLIIQGLRILLEK
jgi:hypothetical protein